MKICIGCRHADWKRTAAGKLHPSGDGNCLYPWKMPPLPGSMYFAATLGGPYGGFISRKRELEKHCPYFEREAAK